MRMHDDHLNFEMDNSMHVGFTHLLVNTMSHIYFIVSSV